MYFFFILYHRFFYLIIKLQTFRLVKLVLLNDSAPISNQVYVSVMSFHNIIIYLGFFLLKA